MKPSRLGALSVSLVAALASIGVACGNSDDSDSGTPDAASSFCTDFATAVQSCALPSACTAEIASICPTDIEPTYSASFTSALHDCASTNLDCDVSAEDSACLFGKMIAVAATDAQATLAKDFCTACVPGSTVQTGAPDGLNCSGHAVTLPQGYGRVMGIDVLALSDGAAVAAGSCVAPAAAAYPDDYENCENTFLNCLSDQQQQAWGAQADAVCNLGTDGGATSDSGM